MLIHQTQYVETSGIPGFAFFLKKSHKDDFLMPMLCTQKGSYQAQNNLGSVTMLTPNFGAKCIHE